MTPVLVACPTYDGKAYALDAYLASYRAQDYPERDLLLVDNSPNEDYARRIAGEGVSVIRIARRETFERTFAEAWAVITQVAYEAGYPWVLSWEQDILLPSGAMKNLVEYADRRDLRLLAHGYDTRPSVSAATNGREVWEAEYGITLISTDVLYSYFTSPTAGAKDTTMIEEWSQLAGKFECIYGLTQSVHLDDDKGNYWPFDSSDVRNVMLVREESAP